MEYARYYYHRDFGGRKFENDEELNAAGDGWCETPAEAEQHPIDKAAREAEEAAKVEPPAPVVPAVVVPEPVVEVPAVIELVVEAPAGAPIDEDMPADILSPGR